MHMIMASTIASLDEAITKFRIATQRPGYRQALLAGLDIGAIAALRLMRSVERLSDGEVGPSIRQLATDLGVEHSTASRSVDHLTRRELLSRHRSPDDQRQTRLLLTARGREVLAEATAQRQEVLRSLVHDWRGDDLRTLTRLLEQLIRTFDDEFGPS